MLLWMFVIILLVGIVIWIFGSLDWYEIRNHFEEKGKAKWKDIFDAMYYNDSTIQGAGMLTTLLSGIVVVIMILVLACNHVEMNAKVDSFHERYDALEYKISSEEYRDEFGLINKSVIDEVQHWNEDLAYYKRIQNDFWIGIFYPNIFDQFETIDYNCFKSTSNDTIHGEMK